MRLEHYTPCVSLQVHQGGEAGVSELRVRLASMSDSGEYQCSTAQYYDYHKAAQLTLVYYLGF